MSAIPKPPGAMSPALLPDREAPYVLRGVYERVVDGCRIELVLQWDGGYLVFRAETDTDSLEADYHEGDLTSSRKYRPLGSVSPWAEYIGKECGWTWIAFNQQGYCDSALISFDGIVPCVLLNVMASSIDVFPVSRG